MQNLKKGCKKEMDEKKKETSKNKYNGPVETTPKSEKVEEAEENFDKAVLANVQEENK